MVHSRPHDPMSHHVPGEPLLPPGAYTRKPSEVAKAKRARGRKKALPKPPAAPVTDPVAAELAVLDALREGGAE